MKIHFWGATEDVTGSMTFLETPQGFTMVDCGLAQGAPEVEDFNRLPTPFPPKEIGNIIITHAHLDHSGQLPRLVKKGFRGSIHCTAPTARLMKIILLDSAKLNEDELYDEKDVRQTLALIKTHDWHTPFTVNDLDVRFIPAGHILGASSVVMNHGGKRIVFSGDLGRNDDPLLPPPESCPEADLVVMESTYGGKNRSGDLEKELHSFLATVSRESRVGIIASFAVARGQSLLTLIHQFYQRHPEEKVRVVMDSPMMKEANKVYQQFSHLTNFRQELFSALDEVDSIDYEGEWESLRKKKGPLIILSSSGMLTGGRIARHLYNWRDDKEAILFLPGYQGQGTPGRHLLEGKRNLLGPRGEPFTWSGEIWSSEAFSSHAEQNELVAWVTEKNKNSRVFLLHGEDEAKLRLKDKLTEVGLSVEIPPRGRALEV